MSSVSGAKAQGLYASEISHYDIKYHQDEHKEITKKAQALQNDS